MLTFVAVFFVVSLVVIIAVYPAYALAPPPGIGVAMEWDFDAARGFEKIERHNASWAPVFVLEQGKTGSVNMTFISEPQENETVSISSVIYGGHPPYEQGWGVGGKSRPDGITYSIEPSSIITLAPGSKTSVTLRILAAPSTATRAYNLTLTITLERTGLEKRIETSTVITLLKIVEGNTTQSNITTNTTTKTACTNQTVTTTTITTNAAATPNLSAKTNTQPTTTLSTTLTSTITAVSTERVTEPSIYAWAIGATVATVVLAIVLLRRRI